MFHPTGIRLLHEALSWEKIMFGVTDANLNISFTRKKQGYAHLGCCWPPPDDSIHQESFLSLHGVFNRVRVILKNTDFPLTFPSPRNLLLLLHGHLYFLHPADSFSFPYHPLWLVLELVTHPNFLSLSHGQNTLTLHFSATLSRQVVPHS